MASRDCEAAVRGREQIAPGIGERAGFQAKKAKQGLHTVL